MSKLFKYCGISRRDGRLKVRWTSDDVYADKLAKLGHKDIDLLLLKEPMTKEAAVQVLLDAKFDNGSEEVRTLLEQALAKRQPQEQKPRARKETKTLAPTLAQIRERKTEVPEEQPDNIENAPF